MLYIPNYTTPHPTAQDYNHVCQPINLNLKPPKSLFHLLPGNTDGVINVNITGRRGTQKHTTLEKLSKTNMGLGASSGT
jgi:hypothetical protein